DLVPGQLSAHRGSSRLPPLPRRLIAGGVPNWKRQRDRSRGGCRRARGQTHRDLLPARRRPPTGVRQLPPPPAGPALDPPPPLPAGPGLDRAHPLPRVLPRRHWGGARRLASNRLDRARGGPDHPPRSRPCTLVGPRAGLGLVMSAACVLIAPRVVGCISE